MGREIHFSYKEENYYIGELNFWRFNDEASEIEGEDSNDLLCEDMDYHANFKCDIHDDPFECPDKVIIYDKQDNDYGLVIHDGGSSSISINFCPWCSTKL
ncbi:MULTISPECIES: DUF6980 family protein [Bacillati]